MMHNPRKIPRSKFEDKQNWLFSTSTGNPKPFLEELSSLRAWHLCVVRVAIIGRGDLCAHADREEATLWQGPSLRDHSACLFLARSALLPHTLVGAYLINALLK